MALELYNSSHEKKMEIALTDSCTETAAIQSDSIISLSFVSFESVIVEVNDYVTFEGKKYWALSRYVPEQVSSVEWKYNLKLYGIESLIKRFLVVNTVNGDDEVEFSYTATAYDHVTLIVKSINEGMGTTEWKVGAVAASEYITIDYRGMYCDVGLKTVAENVGVEYWVEGQTVNVTRCEHGENISLGYGNGLTSLYDTLASNVSFFTRLFPIGSSRNIDPAVYGHSKLQLPQGLKYVDRDVDKFGVFHRYETAAFSDIYPRYTGTISSVRSEEHTNEDGEPFTIFFFGDDALPFDPNDYEIAGLVKMITFTSGDLNGREFEVNYNSSTKEFEIITQYPYGDNTQLPNAALAPELGDEYIPWNISMPDEYYPLAEAEFLAAVNEFVDEQHQDISVYKGHTDYIDLVERKITLTLGQRVRLENETYFAQAYRDSRITKITRKLLRPTDMDIEISDVLSRGALERVDDDVTQLANYIQTAAGGFPDIIRSWEKTLPTDTNILSSRYVFFSFLNKLVDDRSKGKIASDKGFEVGDDAGQFGVDEQGRSFARVDYLYANIKAFFNTLEINRVQANSGNRVASPAAIKCSSVEEQETYYRCFFTASDDRETIKNDFIGGDFAYSLTSGVKANDGSSFESRYYWRAVVGVGDNYIDLSKEDRDPLSDDAPQAGDVIVQRGNENDPTRQNFIEEDSLGANAPSYTVYKGVNSYSLANKEIFELKYDPINQTAILNHYGDAWIGNRARSRGLSYTQDGGLEVFADRVVFGSGKDAEEEINSAKQGKTQLVYFVSASKPSVPEGVITELPEGWSFNRPSTEAMTVVSQSGAWTRKGDAWTSNAIANNQSTVQRLEFSRPGTVHLSCTVSSEASYDFLDVMAGDTPYSRKAGELSISGNVTDTVAVAVNSYVEFGYSKDGSQSTGADEAAVTLLSGRVWVSTIVLYPDNSFVMGDPYEDPQAIAEQVQESVDKIEEDILEALEDGLQENDRTVFIEAQKTYESTHEEIALTYTEVYNSVYLTGSPKTELYNAYANFNVYKNALMNALNTLVTANPMTEALYNAYNEAFGPYEITYKAYVTKLAAANNAIVGGIQVGVNLMDNSAVRSEEGLYWYEPFYTDSFHLKSGETVMLRFICTHVTRSIDEYGNVPDGAPDGVVAVLSIKKTDGSYLKDARSEVCYTGDTAFVQYTATQDCVMQSCGIMSYKYDGTTPIGEYTVEEIMFVKGNTMPVYSPSTKDIEAGAIAAVKVGGVNLLRKSDVRTSYTTSDFVLEVSADQLAGEQITLSVDVEVGAVNNNFVGFTMSVGNSAGTPKYYDCFCREKNFKGRISATYEVPADTVSIRYLTLTNQSGSSANYASRPQIEFGNKATTWRLTPQEVAAEIQAAADQAKRHDYLAEAMKGKVIAQTNGLALSEINAVIDPAGADSEDVTRYVRAFMSGLPDDGLAFGAHSSDGDDLPDAYNICKAYADWVDGGRVGTEPTRPKNLQRSNGDVWFDGADIKNGKFKNLNVSGSSQVDIASPINGFIDADLNSKFGTSAFQYAGDYITVKAPSRASLEIEIWMYPAYATRIGSNRVLRFESGVFGLDVTSASEVVYSEIAAGINGGSCLFGYLRLHSTDSMWRIVDYNGELKFIE